MEIDSQDIQKILKRNLDYSNFVIQGRDGLVREGVKPSLIPKYFRYVHIYIPETSQKLYPLEDLENKINGDEIIGFDASLKFYSRLKDKSQKDINILQQLISASSKFYNLMTIYKSGSQFHTIYNMFGKIVENKWIKKAPNNERIII